LQPFLVQYPICTSITFGMSINIFGKKRSAIKQLNSYTKDCKVIC
jgi:hypothetical protein